MTDVWEMLLCRLQQELMAALDTHKLVSDFVFSFSTLGQHSVVATCNGGTHR